MYLENEGPKEAGGQGKRCKSQLAGQSLLSWVSKHVIRATRGSLTNCLHLGCLFCEVGESKPWKHFPDPMRDSKGKQGHAQDV
jgi:hypothetical protein